MDRNRQDFLTWLLAAGLLVSQVLPWFYKNPGILAGAFGLLGLPLARKAQDAVSNAVNGKNGGPKEGT